MSAPARVLAALRHETAFRVAAVASVVANVLIVVTGGAVRLTASGLGCPTWPTCTADSLVPTSETAGHGIIEFTNRTLTGVIVAVAAITLVVALLQRRERVLAAVAFASIPAQAVLGGITVLTHLNPWAVASHFLLSMGILAVTSTLLWRLVRPQSTTFTRADGPVRVLAWLSTLATVVVLVLGTIVTGSGPHAGDKNDSGKVRRTGLDPRAMSQLHADAVMVLIGLSVGLLLLVVALHSTQVLRRAVAVLLVVELAQGTIGFVQYFTKLPVVLVGFHMFGACLVWLAMLNVLLRLVSPGSRGLRSKELGHDVDQQADERADNRAVHTDELKVSAHL
ncbi:MAG: cytochrome oxidase assembly protein [Pseudonocardiales bacterium]|nr:cytochrome oxidase assembly protein [Pseudonocardiales bacterium]